VSDFLFRLSTPLWRFGSDPVEMDNRGHPTLLREEPEIAPFLISTCVVTVVAVAFWLALALWLKVQQPQRGCATFILSILAFAAFLWIEGSPFNSVLFVMFLPPAALLCWAVVRLLERFTTDRVE